MRYARMQDLLRLALDMQASRSGISLDDIGQEYDVGRRTAERMRDAILAVFPQAQEVETGERTKRWRIPAGTLNRFVGFSAEELTELEAAIMVMRQQNLDNQADILAGVSQKLRALLPDGEARRLEPDVEALLEAEGLAMRPGPKQKVSTDVLADLREAIKKCVQVRIHYHARTTDRVSRQYVCPYGFLYGDRHYLVAYSMNRAVRDYRLFVLSRITRVEVTDRPFRRRRDFSLQGYAERSFGVFQEEPVDVVWKFSPAAADDAGAFLFHPIQTMEACDDGSLIVHFRAGGLREMCWELFRWGDEVEVIAPEALRQMYANCLAEAARALGDGEHGVEATRHAGDTRREAR